MYASGSNKRATQLICCLGAACAVFFTIWILSSMPGPFAATSNATFIVASYGQRFKGAPSAKLVRFSEAVAGDAASAGCPRGGNCPRNQSALLCHELFAAVLEQAAVRGRDGQSAGPVVVVQSVLQRHTAGSDEALQYVRDMMEDIADGVLHLKEPWLVAINDCDASGTNCGACPAALWLSSLNDAVPVFERYLFNSTKLPLLSQLRALGDKGLFPVFEAPDAGPMFQPHRFTLSLPAARPAASPTKLPAEPQPAASAVQATPPSFSSVPAVAASPAGGSAHPAGDASPRQFLVFTSAGPDSSFTSHWLAGCEGGQRSFDVFAAYWGTNDAEAETYAQQVEGLWKMQVCQ